MRSIRLYYPDLLKSDLTSDKVSFDKATIHRLTRVLRLKPEHTLVLFDGLGTSVKASFNSDKATATLTDSPLKTQPSLLQIHLGLGVSKGERMEWAIQKSVEVGVQAITPIICQRTEVKLNEERWNKKLDHWRKIIISAAEQCGQQYLPTLNPSSSLSNFLINSTEAATFILSPNTSTLLEKTILPDSLTTTAILTGPEGGFTEEEIQSANASGFQSWQLGDLIFRAETAPIAAISVLQWQSRQW